MIFEINWNQVGSTFKIMDDEINGNQVGSTFKILF